jgi:hypothetical protein
MDYMDFLDDFAADGDLNRDDPDDPAPYCLACGEEVGIFVPAANGQPKPLTIGG